MKTFICLVLAFLLSHLPHVASAAQVSSQMIPTETVVEEMSRAQTQRKIENILSAPEIRAKLAKLGLSQQEISLRLATLSDTELRQLASQMDQAKYAGDPLTSILVIVVLVLLIIFLAKRV